MEPAERTPSYFVDQVHFPYCKGCSHTQVLRSVDQAMAKLGLLPADIDLTTDIGCVGLADSLFDLPHTVHTTHGRSTAFAVGTVLADRVLASGTLKPVVLIGDGGAMIGLLHIVHAAQVNADVTVVLHNNFLFGMTGGQNSSFSPLGLVTTTTASGNIVPPLDLCRIVDGCGAGYVARKFASDRDLADTIAEAIAHPGFALVEVIELCTAYGTRFNDLGGSRLRDLVGGQGFETGVLRQSTARAEFGSVYRQKFAGGEPPADAGIAVTFAHDLTRQLGLVIGGTAGERVQSSAKMLCQAAVSAGLRTTQKNDNPVTQGTGFSMSEVCLSPEPIHYTGIDSPDAAIVVSADGVRELAGRRVFERMKPGALVLTDVELEIPDTPARVERFPLRKAVSGKLAAATAIGLWVRLSGCMPFGAYEAVLHAAYGDQAERCLQAIAGA